MSFADLKKQSKLGSLTEKLIKQVEKLNDGGSKDDDRFWKPVMDKGGTGSAVIRFLPAPEGCDLPWAQVWSHAFQGTGGWLIDNCLTTLGQNCPVCEANRELWNTGSKDNQNIVRDRKRKLSYFANIYVVKDPRTLRMKDECSFISLVRKSLIRLWLLCNQSLMMKNQSILLISGRVLTSN